MRITDVRIVLHDRRSDTLAVFGVKDGRLPMGVLTITTDEGVEGHNFLSLPGPGPEAVAKQILTFLKPLLLGEDPLDIGALWSRMHGRARYVDPSAIGTVDVALWDIAGKVAGLPVHRLLGTHRHKIPVYFSSGLHPRAEDYAEEAIYWREQGWKGYKLHPPTAPYAVSPEVAPVQADIDGCIAVHEAVGGTMALMLDASWAYSYAEALTVGPRHRGARLHVVRGPAAGRGHLRLPQARPAPRHPDPRHRADARRALRAAAVDHGAGDGHAPR